MPIPQNKLPPPPAAEVELNTLDTSRLEIGMIVKNYKELCNLLNENPKTGNSKNAQLKEWQRYFEFERPKYKQSYIILDIYDEPLDKEDNRKSGNYTVYGNENSAKYQEIKKYFKVLAAYINNPGVYKIENDQYIYIGSTTKSFAKRFSQHYHNYSNQHEKTQNILLNNGVFTCLQSFPPGTKEKIIRQAEGKYISEYKNSSSTKKLINVNMTPACILEKKPPKPKYINIKIPEEYLPDIKECLESYGYFIIENKIVVYERGDQ